MDTASISSPVIDPQTVGLQFIRQYYHHLCNSPEIVYKYYRENSVLSWPGADGIIVPVTTSQGIKNKIMSSDSKNASVAIETADAQDSHMGGVIVLVTGLITGKNNVAARNFTQTFFLVPQERGYDVLNDIFQFIDVHETPTTMAVHDADVDASARPLTQIPEPTDIDHGVENHGSSPAEKVIDNSGKVSKSSGIQGSVIKDVTAVAKASPLASKSDLQPVGAKKISYASMLVKENIAIAQGQVSTGTVVRAAPYRNGQKTTLIPPKSSAPQNVDAPKSTSQHRGLAPSSHDQQKYTATVPKTSAPYTNDPPRSRIGQPQDKSVYIGGLPEDITPQQIEDVVKIFGPVKRGGVQIKRFPDGFGFGFVEFELSNSARSAIEAGKISFGDAGDAYISEKRSSGQVGSGAGRLPSGRDGPRNDKLKGRDYLGQVQETYWKGSYQNEGGKAAAARSPNVGNGESYRSNRIFNQNDGAKAY